MCVVESGEWVGVESCEAEWDFGAVEFIAFGVSFGGVGFR